MINKTKEHQMAVVIRKDPRLPVSIPVTLESRENKEGRIAVAKNVSLSGMYIEGTVPSTPDGLVKVRFSLPGFDMDVEVVGRIVRRDEKGGAINFLDLQEPLKIKLWDFMREKLLQEKHCPYCGEYFEIRPKMCRECGLSLAFDEPDYLQFHKRNSLKRSLIERISLMPDEKIVEIINALGKETKRAWSDNVVEFEGMIGVSDVMGDVFQIIKNVSHTDLPVLICGENGTGKELAAFTIHKMSPRKGKPFSVVNCLNLPDLFVERELFGNTASPEYSSNQSTGGKFVYASGGTLYLDEVGSLSPYMQERILSFIKSGTFLSLNVRIISGTSRDIARDVEEGRFMNELFQRIAAVTIKMPPLRERGEDIILLSKYYLERLARDIKKDIKGFTEEAIRLLKNHSWPGNVTELINRIRRAIIMSVGEYISGEDLGLIQIEGKKGLCTLKQAKNIAEGEIIKKTLYHFGGNISRASKSLGVSRTCLYRLIKKHRLEAIDIKKRSK